MGAGGCLGRTRTRAGGLLDARSEVCITRDGAQLQVDGIVYCQATDPMRASYGSSNYVLAITQLAQKNDAIIVPGNMTEVSALIGTAMTLMKRKAY